MTGGLGTAARLASGTDADCWNVDAPQGGFLRVSGNFDEGWSATVDGRDAKVYLADGLFRGVVVPPGRHSVRFSYHNRAEEQGQLLALAALLVIAGLCGPWPRRRGRATTDVGDSTITHSDQPVP